ncbi:GlxA family transcriptional regulator [Blastopirellula sp. JC732]|uniref:GlxA family transcriptional regulator n=1 Tax=Blastopirellula sediminis TaxID=2894196 RepID=A0A9X1MKP2_9BACT|nr:GlxA family transcriptional regulator [Blastopirellula sediminis]MCC9608294.1 GlxA family transcriptional regulator [Blastopirellula sediminis]MCC9628928.1 GlxA family transcriptional regulator [Blastopirellula sediminis]
MVDSHYVRGGGLGKSEAGSDLRFTLPSPITFLLLPEFTSIAFFSVIEALRVANRYAPKKYAWNLTSLEGGSAKDSNGIEICVSNSIFDLTEPPGTVMVVGGTAPDRFAMPTLFSKLRWFSSQGCLLGAVDTAQQLLAMGGFLDGYRVTVHWENASAFRERFPMCRLTVNLFEFDRNRVTCAGGTAGIDMVLHAVEAEHGRDVAIRASEHFMHERIRSGSEAQRLKATDRWDIHHIKLVKSIELMEAEIEEPLTTAELAAAVSLSSRQLSRLFKEHLNVSPGQFYLELRLDRAHQMILHSELSVNAIAFACGFQSQSHFSRVYREKFDVSPRQTRRREVERQFPVMQAPN